VAGDGGRLARPHRAAPVAGSDAQRGAQFLGEPAAALVAVNGVLGQPDGQHRVHRRGQPGAPLAGGRRICVYLRVHQGLTLVRTERRDAAQQLEPGTRQRVEVGPAIHRVTLDLLGGKVVEAPARLFRRDDLTGCEDLAHPEVGEVYIVAIEKDVGWPDIAVGQAVHVRGIKRGRDLGDDLPGVAGRKRSELAEQRPRVPAPHVAHGDVQGSARLVSLEDGNDVRMIQRGGRPRLPDHPGPEAGVAGQFRRHHLERDPVVPTLIAGEVDGSRAAPPDAAVQPVTGDSA